MRLSLWRQGFSAKRCPTDSRGRLELPATGKPGAAVQLGFLWPELCPGESCRMRRHMLIVMVQSGVAHFGLTWLFECFKWETSEGKQNGPAVGLPVEHSILPLES